MKLEELFMRAFDGEDYVVKPGLDDSVNYAKGLLGISPN